MSTTMAAPARRKVFETPELLSLICSYANRRINLRIMRTNKAGYLSAVPFVWKKVDGIVHLLKLLPRIQIDDDEYSKVQRIVSCVSPEIVFYVSMQYTPDSATSLAKRLCSV